MFATSYAIALVFGLQSWGGDFFYFTIFMMICAIPGLLCLLPLIRWRLAKWLLGLAYLVLWPLGFWLCLYVLLVVFPPAL